MADFHQLIPFFLYYEAGGAHGCFVRNPGGARHYDPSLLPLEEQFEQCRGHGFAHDPADPGGATLCGVTIATYTLYRQRHGHAHTSVDDLRKMAFSEWRDIVKSMYWDRWHGDEIKSQALANILVDWVWASGSNGIRIPQHILGVTADGIVGPRTLAVLNTYDPRALFNAIHAHRIAFVKAIVVHHPREHKFLRGWERRINAITYDGLLYE